jgi:hypothetical protein
MKTGRYAIIEIATEEIAQDKTYDKLRDAKLALRYHFGSRTDKYGIGRIVSVRTRLEWIVDEADKWAEVMPL